MEKISKNVYAEVSGRGCNHSFVVTKEGVVTIDTPMFPADGAKWRDEIAKFGPVRYMINTEPHVDHISGNYLFNAPLIGHEGTRKAILESSVDQYREMLKRTDPQAAVPADFRFRPSDITLSQRLTLHLGEHTFQLINMPGHSPFQVPVYVPEERVVFTSDNVTNGVPPFMHQALPYEWIESLKKLQALEVDWLVPGHGPVCTRAHLTEMIGVIQGAIDAVNAAIKKGMGVAEAQEKLDLFPTFPKNERLQMVQRAAIARLYDVMKPKKS